MPIHRTESSSAPMLRSADTPRDPSSFMMTARQKPSSGSHSRTCSPSPEADATQKVCVPGGDAGFSTRATRVLGISARVEVVDGVVLDALEIAVDLGRRRDAHEHGTLALAADADRSEERVERPLAARVDVSALGDDRVRGRREVPCRRHEEAVVVALRPVDRDESAPTDQQGERDDPGEDADHDQRDTSCGRTRCGAAGGSVAVAASGG